MAGGTVCWREVFGVRFVQVEKWEGLSEPWPRASPRATESAGQDRGSATTGEPLPAARVAIYLFTNLTIISRVIVHVSRVILDVRGITEKRMKSPCGACIDSHYADTCI